MTARLGAFVSRYWPAVLLAWVVAIVAIRWTAPPWDAVTRDGDFAYLPSQTSSARGERLLEEAFPQTLSKSEVVLVVARRDGPLTKEDLAVADALVARYTPVDSSGPITDVLSHQTEVVGQKLVSAPGPEGQALLILLQLRNEFMAVGNMKLLEEINATLEEMGRGADFPAGLQLGVTGSAAIGADMLASAEESIKNTEWATIVLVLLILLVVYRSPGLVVVPLATIAISVVVATGVVALAVRWSDLLGLDFMIFKTTRIFIVVILFGAGTDYCLFLISRYKEELQRGLPPGPAIHRALGRVGSALVASALTTVLGLATMVFCDFGKYRNSGPAIALCLMVALAAAMTLAPALLRAFGGAVFWPLGVNRREDDGRPDANGNHSPGGWFWEPLSRVILARPGWVFLATLAVLVPAACVGWHVDVTYDLLSELPPHRPSVEGTRLLRRYFPAGETGPVSVLAHDPKGGLDAEGALWERIHPLAEELLRLPGPDAAAGRPPITAVRCLTEPLGERKPTGILGEIKDTIIRRHDRTQSTYLAQTPPYAGKVTRFDLVFRHDPFSVQSIHLLDYVESYLDRLAQAPQSPWYGTEFFFVGTTAGIRDLRLVTASDLVLIERLVPIAVLAVLILILRRPWVCVYLILSVLLGYFVTIGLVETFFSRLYGPDYHGLDWKVPMFLFVILIAVGQDYNVYLITRVFEEQRRRGLEEGLRVALVRTGGIITSCGLIMAGTFASMATGTLRAMHELGFALALGVLLDTFVIRTILVPAFLVLWDRRRSTGRSRQGPGGPGAASSALESRRAGHADRQRVP